jgi:peptidoglycan/xylan/chitin deacetylase (PgdA/CDA1 family)
MHRYFIKTPWFVKKIFPRYTWSLPPGDNDVYLTFDDGPHPHITPWVLDELKKYDALATFFCIGKNVQLYPDVYERILREGHSTGNHTHNHLNGWKASEGEYLRNVAEAAKQIKSGLFRPPYGKIRAKQAKGIARAMNVERAKIVMWDVLSADFDQAFSPEQCLEHVMKNTGAGSIVVFHDSEKASRNLKYILPQILSELSSKGYRFRRLEEVL